MLFWLHRFLQLFLFKFSTWFWLSVRKYWNSTSRTSWNVFFLNNKLVIIDSCCKLVGHVSDTTKSNRNWCTVKKKESITCFPFLFQLEKARNILPETLLFVCFFSIVNNSSASFPSFPLAESVATKSDAKTFDLIQLNSAALKLKLFFFSISSLGVGTQGGRWRARRKEEKEEERMKEKKRNVECRSDVAATERERERERERESINSNCDRVTSRPPPVRLLDKRENKILCTFVCVCVCVCVCVYDAPPPFLSPPRFDWISIVESSRDVLDGSIWVVSTKRKQRVSFDFMLVRISWYLMYRRSSVLPSFYRVWLGLISVGLVFFTVLSQLDSILRVWFDLGQVFTEFYRVFFLGFLLKKVSDLISCWFAFCCTWCTVVVVFYRVFTEFGLV